MLSFKALTGKTTSSDSNMFFIRLKVLQHLLISFVLKVSLYISMLRKPPSIIPLFKSVIFWLLETRITNFFSLATLRVVVSSLTLASQLYYILEQLELSLTIFLLRSIDSTFFLQSISSVYIVITVRIKDGGLVSFSFLLSYLSLSYFLFQFFYLFSYFELSKEETMWCHMRLSQVCHTCHGHSHNVL